MTRKLDVEVDLDGVVWDIMNTFVEIYNEIYNENVKYEDIDDWYFFSQERFEKVYPLTLPRIMEYPMIDKDIASHLFVLNMDYNINILTKEQNPIELITEKLKAIGIIKDRGYNSIRKIELSDKKVNYPADVYIDDCPNMIKDMIDYPNRVLLLYDRPWNKKAQIKSKNVIRVYTWSKIFEHLNKIRLTKAIDKNAVFC